MSEVKRYRFISSNGYPAIPVADSVKAERYVEEQDFDRVTAELASANSDKEAYAQNAIDLRKRVDALQALLTAADERADALGSLMLVPAGTGTTDDDVR